VLTFLWPAPAPTPAGEEYRAAVEKWRAEREARLRAEDGWLSVVGLYWLEDGASRFGTDASNEIVLPPGTAPARAGVFEHQAGTTELRLEPGVAGTLGGRPVTRGRMRPDGDDVLRLGRLSFQVIERGGRFGIRLKDVESAARRGFEGLRWFPVRESYRVTARFEPAAPGKTLPIPNVLGQVSHLPSPGRAVFEIEGREMALEPVLEEPEATELFFIFRDGTSGKETYGAGRFLYAAMPEDGRIVLDFNRAYSPPCAFTDYATCPLPPPQNRLPVRIEAGELAPHAH
jgi:uncharacterized protein (DUF1684 family)